MTDTSPRLRINRLKIENYKKIDHLEIEFPLPLMEGDPDIFVLGSKNGGGKTSVLECCSMITLAGLSQRFSPVKLLGFSVFDSIVRAGQSSIAITADFSISQQSVVHSESIQIAISLEGSVENGLFDTSKKGYLNLDLDHSPSKIYASKGHINSIISLSGEPLIIPNLLHFNSYRKISPNNPKLGKVTESSDARSRSMLRTDTQGNLGTSEFKSEVIRILMARASLFEGIQGKDSESNLEKLNELTRKYAGGEIEKLGLSKVNTVDLRIKSNSSHSSFSFDNLSSGQKEIISTLFLIWRHTQNRPSIVIIDEPELHLNAEWHRDFIYQLHRLAPQNQYIIATHSEQIFGSVDSDRRAILVPS